MNNLLSKRKIWKSPVTPFNRLSLSGRDDEDYYDDYYYDDEVDRDDKDVSARSRAEVGLYRAKSNAAVFLLRTSIYIFIVTPDFFCRFLV